MTEANRPDGTAADERPNAVQPATSRRSFARAKLKHPLLRTAASLYLVQSAALLVPLLTLPYLSRVLSPTNLGLLLVFQAYASIATLIVLYGFDLSASRAVAQAADDQHKIQDVVAGVLSARIVLAAVSALASVAVGLAIPLFRERPAYLAAAWALSVAQGWSPLWYFLGRERMGVPATIDIGSKIAAVGAIFVFVHDADDAIVVLVIQAVTTAIGVAAAVGVMGHLTSFPRLRLAAARKALRENVQLAMFSVLATAGLYMPTLFVGVLTSPLQAGFYSLADKLQKVPTAVLWPLSQALYPRINRLLGEDPVKAKRLIWVSGVAFVSLGFAAGAALIVVADWLVPVVFGSEYEPATAVFRVLALALPFGLLGHVLAYQVLMPSGRDKVLNYITWLSMAVSLSLAVPLTLTFGAVGMAWAVLVNAVLSAAILAYVILTSANPLFPRGAEQGAKAR